jgi:hypothetical protein
MRNQAGNDGAVGFAQVLCEELEAIDQARKIRNTQVPMKPCGGADLEGAYRAAHDRHLLGLAVSGGGIRSATVNLGVLQALAKKGVLPWWVDYLSTVSGGGYLGGWLISWMQRNSGKVNAAALADVQEQLTEQAFSRKDQTIPKSTLWQEPPPITHLRQYSNYLTPRLGVFSADSWSMAAIWGRNTMLNLLILIAGFAALLLLPRLIGFIFIQPWNNGLNWCGQSHGVVWAMMLLLLPPVLLIGCNLLSITDKTFSPGQSNIRQWYETGLTLHLGIVIPTLVSAVLISQRLMDNAEFWRTERLVRSIIWPNFWPFGALFLLFLMQQSVAGFVDCFSKQNASRPHKEWNRIWFWCLFVAIPIACGFITAALLYGLAMLGLEVPASAGEHSWRALVWGPPAVMWALASGVVIQIGLMGHDLPDAAREWLGRLRAWMMIYSLGWIALFGASLYGPYWMAKLGGSWGKTSTVAALTWLATTAGGLLAAKSGKTNGKPKEPDEGKNSVALEALARVAPYVFVVGFVLLIAFGVHALATYAGAPHQDGVAEASLEQLRITPTAPFQFTVTRTPAKEPPYFPALEQMAQEYWRKLGWEEPAGNRQITPVSLAWPWQWQLDYRLWISGLWHLFFVCAAATLLLSWRVDINDFSLHHFYKNRLVRCYLGASNPKRRPNPFTGFDEGDDQNLANFIPPTVPVLNAPHAYCGPYPIINATLNVSSGGNLAWQERKAASYTFTPLYSGYDNEGENQKARLADGMGNGVSGRPAYRKTNECAYEGGINLGTAVAISGAAANPNGGFHTSTSVAFLMTVFNVRLGWWLGNPKYKRSSQMPGPPFGLLYTVQELFGSTNANSEFVNLSDGGHFENMGIYELVRRRCRYIICCDGEQDDQFTFGGLASAIRKCRTDFGVEIDIDLQHIKPKVGFSQAHCAVGRIYYQERSREEAGYLLYFKSSLTGDEPSDVLEYHARHSEFPHQSTGDQWFDESQFESYRRLGLHMGDVALASVHAKLENTEEFFKELELIWYPPRPAAAQHAASHAKTYADLMSAVRADTDMAFLDEELLNGWTHVSPVGGNTPELRRSRYHCDSLFQLMQQVFHDLNLEDERAWRDPHVHGWLKIFSYWTHQDHINETWKITQKTYSPRFQKFYEKVKLREE